ncbi:hypothetical protein P12x_002639 [Tundrisphaera lichenicola]|uniref:hypothetical protein n=1 Tax=Tundrisphaera lichenicola TaxID=2029860 RepID=UPI003EB8BA95
MADNESKGSEGVAGAAAGGAGGAVMGTILGLAAGGPLGAAVGVAVGTLAGAAVGYSVDYEHHEQEFLDYHKSDPARASQPWERANPAYRYGWESHDRPEFRDKTYDHVQPDLQKGWTGSGDFADYEPYVKHAWERRAAVMQDGSKAQPAKE